MQLAVLNPGGKDPEQHFADFAGVPDDRVHAPVNYHAYAACTGGGFYQKPAAIPAGRRHVLLLLRRDLKPCLKALHALKQQGHVVAVSWKESGLHQVADQLNDADNLALFQEILGLADGALSSTPELVTHYQSAGARLAVFIPTPYPVDDARWDFSIPEEKRSGIFLGTREWDVPSRNHLFALQLSLRGKERVTVVNQDGRAGRRKLEALGGDRVKILEGRRPYPAYLREVAQHRLVFQLDASAVPGQVAGDALLCHIPCIGGNSAIERVAFPGLSGSGSFEPAAATLERLIADPAACRAEGEAGQQKAMEQVSFQAVARRLAEFFTQLTP